MRTDGGGNRLELFDWSFRLLPFFSGLSPEYDVYVPDCSVGGNVNAFRRRMAVGTGCGLAEGDVGTPRITKTGYERDSMDAQKVCAAPHSVSNEHFGA